MFPLISSLSLFIFPYLILTCPFPYVEWYDEQAAAGLLPTPDQSRVQMDRAMRANDPEVRQAEEERKAAEEDEKEEEDDEQARRKKIEWDDWRDDHRRGWGNRKNMG